METVEIGASNVSAFAEINDFTYIGDKCKIGDAKIGYGYLPHKTEFDTVIQDGVTIHDNALILKGAQICENSVIAENVKIGEGAYIAPNSLIKAHVLPFESFDGKTLGVHKRALIDFVGMEKGFEVVEKFIRDLRKAKTPEARKKLVQQVCAENSQHKNYPLQEAIGIISMFIE